MWFLMGMKNVIRNWRKGDLCYNEVKHLVELCLVFSGKQNIFVMSLNDYLRRFQRKKNVRGAIWIFVTVHSRVHELRDDFNKELLNSC